MLISLSLPLQVCDLSILLPASSGCTCQALFFFVRLCVKNRSCTLSRNDPPFHGPREAQSLQKESIFPKVRSERENQWQSHIPLFSRLASRRAKGLSFFAGNTQKNA
jgi:hypothetical protein